MEEGASGGRVVKDCVEELISTGLSLLGRFCGAVKGDPEASRATNVDRNFFVFDFGLEVDLRLLRSSSSLPLRASEERDFSSLSSAGLADDRK
jgi:hypothetical protein